MDWQFLGFLWQSIAVATAGLGFSWVYPRTRRGDHPDNKKRWPKGLPLFVFRLNLHIRRRSAWNQRRVDPAIERQETRVVPHGQYQEIEIRQL